MDQNTAATSLLTLNEYCLLDIFKFLKLSDLVNLDKTCTRLKCVGARICSQNCKKIEVHIYNNKDMKNKEISNTLSVIGEHILSMSVNGANQSILHLIRDNCKNLRSIELSNFQGSIQLQCFENLKELKLNAVTITTNELKTFFAKNAELECLEYHCFYREDLLELVHMLPKLQSLYLDNVSRSIHLSQHLHCLDRLAKFSFSSLDHCNQLLIKMAKSAKLKELHVWMILDTDTFDIIKSFPSLEVFSLHQFGENENLPEGTVFPSTLKSVKMTGVTISFETLLSAVKELKYLDEFDLGYRRDFDKCKLMRNRFIVLHSLNICLFQLWISATKILLLKSRQN